MRLPSGGQLRRPVQLLFPLEIRSGTDVIATGTESDEPEIQELESTLPAEASQVQPAMGEQRRHSQRAAAKRADNQRKALRNSDLLQLTMLGQQGEDVGN